MVHVHVDDVGYYHPIFLREQPELCKSINCVVVKSQGVSSIEAKNAAKSFLLNNLSSFYNEGPMINEMFGNHCESGRTFESSTKIDELFGHPKNVGVLTTSSNVPASQFESYESSRE
jgi:hypothetical protein